MENDKKGYISLIMDEASNEIMGLQVSDSPNFNLVRNTLREKIDSLTTLKKVCSDYKKWFNYERISRKKELTPIEYRNKFLKIA